MTGDAIPIYGSLQYPHMDLFALHNPVMDINKTISTNLVAWMDASPTLNTLKKVAAHSGVGFGTVQRMRNGEGNATIQNLELIARAFRRRTTDLISPPLLVYEVPPALSAPVVDEPNVVPFMPDNEHPAITEVTTLMRHMSDHEKSMALKMVRLIADEHQAPKTIKEQ